jgi:hypothetical protein
MRDDATMIEIKIENTRRMKIIGRRNKCASTAKNLCRMSR